MRIPSLLSICLAFCLSSSVHASLSLSDLPYVQGTPVVEGAWEIQDYAQGTEGIQWIWLRQGRSSAYVVYPSEEAVLLPDNSQVPGSTDQITLRFAGDPDQEWVFTRFGNAHFTLIGDTAQVRYTAVAANTSAGAYPGDLSMDAREIHMEGELMLDGNMALDAQETLGLYGKIDVQDQLLINAGTGAIMGSVENNGTLLLDACGAYSSASLSSVHIDTTLVTKGCVGDVLVLPEAPLNYRAGEASNLQTSAQTSGSAKGGAISWWLIGLLGSAFLARRKTNRRCSA